MLTPPSYKLSPAAIAYLKKQQTEINEQPSYEESIKKAKQFWENRKSNNTFKEIKAGLKEMAVAKKYCCYCESNEFSDIEHFYPKTLFPQKAFVWENYLYVCGLCNSKYKNDTFAIFTSNNSTSYTDITPSNPRIYQNPATTDAVLINPRKENPMDFLWLNIARGEYISNPFSENLKEDIRANYTIDTLNLARFNEARKNKAQEFLMIMSNYLSIKRVSSLEALEEIAQECYLHEKIDFVFQNLQKDKAVILENFKQTIIQSPHSTVWEEIKRQRHTRKRWKYIFSQIPEALTW